MARKDSWIAERGFKGQEELFHFDCLLSGSRLLSDKFAVEEVNGVVFRVESQLSLERGGDVDSTLVEEGGFAIDLVELFQLQKIALTKREYITETKSYLTSLEQIEATKKEFRQQAVAFLKTVVLPDFRNFRFYVPPGPPSTPSRMIILSRWEGSALAFYYWICGLRVIREKAV